MHQNKSEKRSNKRTKRNKLNKLKSKKEKKGRKVVTFLSSKLLQKFNQSFWRLKLNWSPNLSQIVDQNEILFEANILFYSA